jgi:peroxiredoxin Q/BCP
MLNAETGGAAKMVLAVGDRAPSFDVTSSNGERLALTELRSRPVVLYFYPRDFSLGCVMEACQFRDAHEAFASFDAKVIGVSPDTNESHERFRAQNRLPYPLVSDPKLVLAESFGATNLLRSMLGAPRRITFVIDRGGIIAGVVASELRIRAHAEGVRSILLKMRRQEQLAGVG